MSSPNIDDRDWSRLTLGERIRQLEVEGYFVMPDLLAPDRIAELKAQTAKLPTVGVDYSVYKQSCSHVEFVGGAITELAAHSPTIAFLKALCGEEILVVSYDYQRSEPGHPGISLHTDGQPWGSRIFGYEGTCPKIVRVLYYLDDLTQDVSPFRVVPRSHLSFHVDRNPYTRYASHPEEVMVPAKAGSAVFLNHFTFHGNYPNTGDRSREMLAIAYRPAWAGPVDEVPRWDEAEVARLPDHIRPLYGDPNRRRWNFGGGNKPAGMAREAPGMNPSRWNRT